MTLRVGSFYRTFRFGLVALFMCSTFFALGVVTERHFGNQISGPSIAAFQKVLSGDQKRIEDLHAQRDKIITDLVLRIRNDLKTETPATDLATTLRNSYRKMQRVQDIDFEVTLHQKDIENRTTAYVMAENRFANRQ